MNTSAKEQETSKAELQKKLKDLEDSQSKSKGAHEKELTELKNKHSKELSVSDQAKENEELKKKTEDI